MQMRVIACVPAISLIFFAAASALDPAIGQQAVSCLERPDHAPTAGGHWYYHLDRANDRKCWYLAEPTASPPEAPALQPPQQAAAPPEANRQQQPFNSFFSSLGFSTASLPAAQPDPLNRELAAQPGGSAGDDPAATKLRRHLESKPAPAAKPVRQAASHSSSKPAEDPPARALDQAERDALFQEYLRWRESQ
jgi:hypothetical protein